MDIKKLLGDVYKEDMTADEIVKALVDVESPSDNSAEVERLREALTKSNKEASDYKKQLREKLTEEEARKQDEENELKQLKTNYEKLLHESKVSKTKSELLEIGYDGDLALETAEAIVSGDMKKIIANQKKYTEQIKNSVLADALKNTPKPVGDGDTKTMTIEKLREMDSLERMKFAQENPEVYKNLYSGE